MLGEAIIGSFGSAAITVKDLSASGAQIEHAQPLRIGTKARLWFKRTDVTASAYGLSVWSRLSKTPDVNGKYLYRSGLRIEFGLEEFILAVQALIDRGVARPDIDSMDRKRQRLLDRQNEKKPLMKVIRSEEVPSELVLLIEHTLTRLRSHPDEAQIWYNRARLAMTETGAFAADSIRYREDALAVWEYLERSVELSMILRVMERMRSNS